MKLNPLILAFGIIPLTGCGGGGGDDSSNTSTYSVTAIDGYLRNAQVWLDINSNYQLDDEEPSTTTGEGGNAELDVTGIENPEQYSVVVKAIARQTIDEDTITTSNPSGSLTTSSFILSAPAGQQIITPLSTLIDLKMKNGQTQQEALTELSSELNIEETAILNDYLDTEQGAVAAKAKSLILLGVIPDSEENMAALSDGTSNIDEVLTESTLISLQSIEADQLLVNDENQLTTIDIVGTDDVDYDPDANGADKDGDGIINILDAFPNDVSETADSDNDSVGDNEDDFPYNATETVDTDNDGVGDNEDPDANGDGVIDVDEAGFEYASFENKRLYNVYLKEADSGVYYNINTYLFHSSNENLEFGYGYLDENDDYFVDATSWTITDGSLVIPDYGSRYKLIESTNDYFKVCYSGDITNDVLCDDSYASYFFFDKTTAKTFISSNSTTGTNIDLSNMTDSSLSSYFSALEYDVAEQVSTIDLYDIGIDSLSGIEQFELLEKLFAGNNHITDISPLNNFTHLRYLQIQEQFDNDTNDDLNLISYEPILTMPSLTRLNLTEYGDLPPNNAFDLAAMINGLDDKSSMTRLELYGVDLNE
ncbi:hypothetical protein [Psychromonas sp. KJ10-2]|uniref:hypothetical protein n=1 Tax=Psychromonas sp. KJ10-2 TaxID=3391822 RepID=UPI0039B470EF